MDESIRSFLTSVIIPECRVQNTPHLIFLCGGETRKDGPYVSARDFFFRHVLTTDQVLAKRVRLAEKINDWFDHDLFVDLLEVEEILADCSDLTILFVESPGSIAELGAFAASRQLRAKTLAVLNSTFKQERTFIADGPVRRIKSIDQDLVRYWRWDTAKLNSRKTLAVFKELSRDLVSLIREKSSASPKQEMLDRELPGHTMFLIADYIDMVGISFRTEILDCLTQWGYEIDLKTLDKYLSLLEHFNLIRREPLSNQTYYLSRVTTPLIKYAFAAGSKPTDRGRLKSAIRSSLEKSDERRVKLLRRDLAERAERSRRRG